MHPVVAGLSRQRTAALLLVGQVALTVAITVNAAALVQRELGLLVRPTGLVEQNLWLLESRLGSDAFTPDAAAADLAALRALPGIAAATRINVLPLADLGWRTGLQTAPLDEPGVRDVSALYFTDEHGPATLGIRLVAGRSFTAADVGTIQEVGFGPAAPRVGIISAALARTLFGEADPLGRKLYSHSLPPVTVIGVVERLQSAWPSWEQHEHALLMPAHMNTPTARYLLRTRDEAPPGWGEAATARLREVDPARTIDPPRPYADVRRRAYQDQRGLASMLTALILALLFVTALGIVAIASFRVSSRTRQIGTRRALGATRRDILLHFLGENFIVMSAGIAAGIALTYVLHGSLGRLMDMPTLSPLYLPGAALLLWGLGLAAAWGPARRAAAVPPVAATRNL